MSYALRIAVAVIAIAGILPAQSQQPAFSQTSLHNATGTIQSELEGHGERVLGRNAYRWQTRLEKQDGCRVEFSVRTQSNLSSSTVNVERVQFSLGALDPYSIEFDRHRLQMNCMRTKCIFSTTTCTRTSAGGVVVDCTTPNQKRADGFALQVDGDAASVERLQQAFRQAVLNCRQPKMVSF